MVANGGDDRRYEIDYGQDQDEAGRWEIDYGRNQDEAVGVHLCPPLKIPSEVITFRISSSLRKLIPLDCLSMKNLGSVCVCVKHHLSSLGSHTKSTSE